MARAKKTFNSEEAYSMPFPTRLRELLNKNKTEGKTQEDLADAIGVKRQSISQWQYGNTFPDVNVLNNIANYYCVSADYLLGRTDIRTPIAENIAIHAKTGLSERAIEILSENNYDEAFKGKGGMLPMLKNNFTRTVNYLLENPKIIEFISKYLFSDFVNVDNPQNPALFTVQNKDYAGLEFIHVSDISNAYLVKVQAELLLLKREMEKECE